MADLVFTITVDEADVPGLGYALGYVDDIPDPADPFSTIPNTESVEDYIKRWILDRYQSEWAFWKEQQDIASGFVYVLGIS